MAWVSESRCSNSSRTMLAAASALMRKAAAALLALPSLPAADSRQNTVRSSIQVRPSIKCVDNMQGCFLGSWKNYEKHAQRFPHNYCVSPEN